MAQAKTEQLSLLTPNPATPLGGVERFVVADVIKLGNELGGIKITWIGERFKRHFLGVVEENVPARNLPGNTLSQHSHDEPIIAALGGTIKDLGPAATALAHLFGVIPLGKTSPDFFNSRANIGYAVSPVDQESWAVYWRVLHGELSVGASQASNPNNYWVDGDRVFGG